MFELHLESEIYMILKSQKRKKKGECLYYRRWKHRLHWTGEKEQL